MAVGPEDAGTVGIVQQHELAGQLVLVRRDPFAKDAQLRIAIPLRHVAQHLIVGAVFFDDVDDVPDQARLADPLGHRAGRLVRPRRQQGLADPLAAEVVPDRLR